MKGTLNLGLRFTASDDFTLHAIFLAKNGKNNPRTKHIDVKYHYARDKVERKVTKIEYLPTCDMVADTLTKSLPRVKFEEFREENSDKIEKVRSKLFRSWGSGTYSFEGRIADAKRCSCVWKFQTGGVSGSNSKGKSLGSRGYFR